MQPDDKDAALLPRRIGGTFKLLHRPIAAGGAQPAKVAVTADDALMFMLHAR